MGGKGEMRREDAFFYMLKRAGYGSMAAWSAEGEGDAMNDGNGGCCLLDCQAAYGNFNPHSMGRICPTQSRFVFYLWFASE